MDLLVSVAIFLLDHPPLDEIGGPITDIIESYRYGTITKDEAIDQMFEKHKSFLVKCSKGFKI